MLGKKEEFGEIKFFFLNLLELLNLIRDEDIKKVEQKEDNCLVIIKKGGRDRIKCYWDSALGGLGFEDYELLWVLLLKYKSQNSSIFDLKEILEVVNQTITPRVMDIPKAEGSLKRLSSITIVEISEKKKSRINFHDYFISKVDLRNK